MDHKIKTIGILTSGGDAPGMNAAVRAVTRTALFNGINVKGIYKGFNGLMSGNMKNLTLRDVSGILERGGTCLYSARCPEFNSDEGVEKGKLACQKAGIDALVVCGGDGSFRGARDLSLKGVPCIGIPCTIDNDIAATEYSIGYDTAINTVVKNIDKLRDTSQSHDRCSVVEVMGRNCGDIALRSAICDGAVSFLVPEIEYDLERDIINKMRTTLGTGKSHFIVIVAEGVTQADPKFEGDEPMDAARIAAYIQEKTGVEARATVIGHVQRGGSPSARDRVIASEMGHYAVELLMKGIGNRIVTRQGSTTTDVDILEGLKMEKTIDINLVRVANEISI
ncbi:MAG: 6-phosphofructokinase [Oscillospiraceae bacterium]|nr:6-phosphofructokinase [Oscillospiraceae bacterium]